MKRLVFTFFLLLYATAVFAYDPCCSIKSIDLKTGIVKAAPNQPPDGFSPVDSARSFEFTVTNATLLRSLKAGDAINADFAKTSSLSKRANAFRCALCRSDRRTS
jgi:Cu/Ag efflux protein CusF